MARGVTPSAALAECQLCPAPERKLSEGSALRSTKSLQPAGHSRGGQTARLPRRTAQMSGVRARGAGDVRTDRAEGGSGS